ncbi:MAG: rRNA pseudouridine synthase [Flavobacteriales bacterium]|nr:rRNA pseudouridine synthase [Flavobacteriales bacterium]MDW8432723.1 pseudouridine synthase [Flavobacteriales bacterium]
MNRKRPAKPPREAPSKGHDKPQGKRHSAGKEAAQRKPHSWSAKNSGPRPSKKLAAQAGMRLNRYLAHAGICSRREADGLIAQGLVKVNGRVVQTMGYIVQPEDVVQFDDRRIYPEKPVYILLNKPKDYITTTDDEKGRRTVMDLVRDCGATRLFPVGRLDRHTTGLLLLTNDGDLAERLAHPRRRVEKLYKVTLDKNLKSEDFEKLRTEGVQLEDGPFKPDEIEYVDGAGRNTLGVLIHSGRNRIVRRMFEALGYTVTRLDRVMYAGLTKARLPRGKWRPLTPAEVGRLKKL